MAHHPHTHHHSDNGDASDKWQKREHYRHQYTPDSYSQKQAFRRASTSLGFVGFAGHMLRTGGILVPLVVDQFIPNPETKWKVIRISAIAAAMLSEALYGWEHSKGKQACREEHEARDEEIENRLRSALAGGDMAGALGVGR